jgi:hypothetical protein
MQTLSIEERSKVEIENTGIKIGFGVFKSRKGVSLPSIKISTSSSSSL